MKRVSIVIVTLIMSVITTYGQCAMCKAALETKVGDTDYVGIGAGINAGVLYLMFVPYILLILVVLLFRFQKKQAQRAE